VKGDAEESHKGYNINLDALLADVRSVIAQTAYLIAYGLTITESAQPESLQLPGALIQFKLEPEPSTSEIKKDFTNWLRGMCLRRYVEVYHAYLQSVGVVASLVERNRSRAIHTWDQQECSNSVNQMTFPQKLDHIDSALSMSVSPKSRLYLSSINKARNCYEHRSGIVHQRDLNQEHELVVRWYGLDLFTWPGGSEPPSPETDISDRCITNIPFTSGVNEGIWQRTVERSKSFKVGDQLTFSTADLSEIGHTFIRHALDTVQAVKNAFDQDRGIDTESR